MDQIGVVDPIGVDGAPEGSFESFYRRQFGPMLRLAYLLTQSQAAAEDLVQDSFLRIQPRWKELDSPVAYLRRTVTNACYTWQSRQRRERGRPVDLTPSRDPEYDDMWDALAGLAPRRRAALVLRYYLDLSEAEIAEALGCRPGTVKSVTHRALADLRKSIER